jgi:hypothetical protein
MSINVVVSSTAAGVSVSGGTSVAITVGGGIGPAGFLVAPGTATNAFGTFQLTAGDGITISTSAAQFQIASYGPTAVSSLAPVQSVAGRVGAVQLQASDVTAGTFAIARIPTISYTALANVPATFSPSAHTHSTSDVVSFTAAAAAAAPVQSVAGRSGAISLTPADIGGLAAVATSGSYTSLQNVPATLAPQAHTHSTADITGFTGSFASGNHTHDATAITSGVLDLARIPTIGYTALSGVPATFAPQAHTHSTADVVGLTSSFSQVGHSHDYVRILNGLTGTVSIAGGAGVTVSTASSSITISAGGGGGSANIVEAATAAGFPGTGASQTLYHATDVRRIYFWDATGGVYVEAGPSSGGGGSSGVVVAASAASFPATGASNTLYVSTAARTISYWSGSEYITLGVSPLTAPTGLTAAAGNAQVLLQWTPPAGTITTYRVQSSLDGVVWTTIENAITEENVVGNFVVLTGLTNGTTLVFRIAAVNGAGVGTYTAASSSVTPTGAVFRAIPTMTSLTSPSGVVSGENNIEGAASQPLWQAFDGNSSTPAQFQRSGFNTPSRMIQYAFPAGQKSNITGYSITQPQPGYTEYFSQWLMYGSDDLSTWTEIDSRSGITGWTSQQAKQFTLSQQRNFRAYRWVFQPSADLSGPNQISTLQLTE